MSGLVGVKGYCMCWGCVGLYVCCVCVCCGIWYTVFSEKLQIGRKKKTSEGSDTVRGRGRVRGSAGR
jgi:hypothetical protein